MTLALIGFLAYQALAVRESGPRLRTEVVAVEQAPPGFVAEVRVHNDGGGTAESVHQRGAVPRGGQATATISYVPPHSARRAALVFGVPSSEGLDVRVAGCLPS